MEQRLVKGMYGTEFRPTSNLFDLRCGQCCGRQDMLVKNAGWYNRCGEKLGWGDLSVQNFRTISKDLEEDELFIILYEKDSYWNFVQFPKSGHIKIKSEVEAPGVDYVVDRCSYIVAKNQLYIVNRGFYSKNQNTYKICGLKFKVLSHEAAKKMITS